MYALPELRIFCFEKIVLKLFLIILALTIFSGQELSVNAYNYNNTILHGYVKINNNIEEEQNNALFLLNKSWEKELENKYKNFKTKKIENGIFYIKINKTINGRKIKINVAEINRNINKNIEIIPQLAQNKLHAKSKINNIGENSLISINGTYFKQNTGTPLGTLVINNEILTGPIYDRVALSISNDSFKIDNLSFSGTIESRKNKVKLDNINQPRMSKKHTLIYTEKWGKNVPNYDINLKHIAILNNKIIAISNKALHIPKNGVVIVGSKKELNHFKIGQKVKINYKLNSIENTKHIISGGPFLIKNGDIYIDTVQEKLNAITGRNPRTAIGYTKDNVLIMVTIDGRKEGTSGVTLKELATIMKNLGCTNAMNLDGGSSTVMYVNGKVINGSNIKSVSISNALTVKIKSPV